MIDQNMDGSASDWRCDLALIQRYLHERATYEAPHTLAPVCIVDLTPGNGERAWQLLARLPQGDVQYLALCRTAEAHANLCGHPSLLCMTEQGRLRIGRHPGSEAEWRSVLPAAHGPLVILAHGLFSTLRHDRYACHYGHWMRPDPGGIEGQPCWRAIAPTDLLGRLLAPAYLHSLNSTSLLLPNGSVECLEPLLRVSGGRYLLVASDYGISDLTEIRLGALHTTPEQIAAQARMPVNFHALGVWQASMGARCACVEGAFGDGRTRQLALRDDACPDTARLLSALQQKWHAAQTTVEGWRAMLTPLAAMAPDDAHTAMSAFALWQVSHHAPEVLSSLAAPLVALSGSVEGPALRVWRQALLDCCRQYFPDQEGNPFCRNAACLAAGLGMWSTAVELLETEGQRYGCDLESIRLLSDCLQMCGRSEHAFEVLEQALLSSSDAAAMRNAYGLLRARLQSWDNLAWYAPDIAASGLLRLEPLGTQHAPAMLYQYRDPQIGMMTRLPGFTGLYELEDWIAERREEVGRMDFAVVHADHGFAGVVSAHRVDKNAFIHFWIGVDFQGQGLAVQAFALLRAQLERQGLKRLFTTAYPDNFRSLRVLRHCGFQPMPDRALPPEECMPFMCLELTAEKGSALENSLALRDYSGRSGGVFSFASLEEQEPTPAAVAHTENRWGLEMMDVI